MAVVFGVLLYAFIKNTAKDVGKINEDKSKIKAVDFISFVPGILIVILIYVYNGLSMSGWLKSTRKGMPCCLITCCRTVMPYLKRAVRFFYLNRSNPPIILDTILSS